MDATKNCIKKPVPYVWLPGDTILQFGIFAGPPTHSVGGPVLFYLLASVVVVCRGL